MAIKNVPVDVGRLSGFTCSLLPAPYMDRDSGEPRTDRESGLPLYQVGVTVRLVGAREVETWTIQVPGEPVGLVEDEKVKVFDLSVAFWSRDGRSGMTYRASAITPVNAPAPAAASDPGSARPSGSKAAPRE